MKSLQHNSKGWGIEVFPGGYDTSKIVLRSFYESCGFSMGDSEHHFLWKNKRR